MYSFDIAFHFLHLDLLVIFCSIAPDNYHHPSYIFRTPNLPPFLNPLAQRRFDIDVGVM